MKKSTSLILVIGLLSAGLMYFWPIEEIRLVQAFLSAYFVGMMWVFCNTLDRPRWYASTEIANMVGTLIVLAGSVFRPDTYVHLWPVFMAGLLVNTIAAGIFTQFYRDRPLLEQSKQNRKALLFVLAGAAIIAVLFAMDRCTSEQHAQTELLKEIAHPDSVKANPTLLGKIGQVDTSVIEAAKLDSAQNDTLIALHAMLLEEGKKNSAFLEALTKQLKTKPPIAYETSAKTDSVSAAAPTRRERRKLRRAARKAARARRDSLRHAGVE